MALTYRERWTAAAQVIDEDVALFGADPLNAADLLGAITFLDASPDWVSPDSGWTSDEIEEHFEALAVGMERSGDPERAVVAERLRSLGVMPEELRDDVMSMVYEAIRLPE